MLRPQQDVGISARPPPPPPPLSSTPPATAPTSGTPDRTLPTSRAYSSPSSSAARTATSSTQASPSNAPTPCATPSPTPPRSRRGRRAQGDGAGQTLSSVGAERVGGRVQGEQLQPDLSAGLTPRARRESFAGALGLPLATTTVASVTDEDPGDGSGSTRVGAFIVSGIADPAEVARAWPEVETAAFAADVTSRMKSNGLSSTATAGSSGAGVTAILTVEVRARDEGSWIRLANGAGILAGDLEKAMEGVSAELRTPVAGATRTVVAARGSAPALPRDAPIRDSGPLSRYDVVHPIGEARRMTVLVVRVNEANIPTTGHVVRVSFINQRPGRTFARWYWTEARAGTIPGCRART